MKPNIYNMIDLALASDDTLSPDERQAILDRCRNPGADTPAVSRDDRTYLTADEVAKELQISRRTVRRHIRSGKLKSMKAGAVRRIRLSDLERFLRAVVDWATGLLT